MGLMQTFRQLLLPRPKRKPHPRIIAMSAVARILVFGRMPNPTFDYYLAARLEAEAMPPFEVHDIRRFDPETLEAEGSLVIIVRYASPALLRWIAAQDEKLAGVGLLLDDDIAAVITGREADPGYRFFLWYRAVWPLYRLNRHLDWLWLSTPGLKQALGEPGAKVLPPCPAPRFWQGHDGRKQGDAVVIAYHATGIHVSEHRFLRPVVEQLLALRPEIRVEIFAGPKAQRLWTGLDRVQLFAPVSWTDYLAMDEAQSADILLVPLMASRENASRSPTKHIDAARMGAAGIFSASAAYGPADPSRFILPNDPGLWVKAIVTLIDDVAERAAQAERSRFIVQGLLRQGTEPGSDLL